MRFDKSGNPVPYLNKRDQRRLLILCGMLLIILLAMRKAADPKTWWWLLPPKTNTEVSQVGKPEGPVDSSEGGKKTAAPEVRRDETGETAIVAEDDRLGIGKREAESYFRLLARADRRRVQSDSGEAPQEADFRVLMSSPDEYRGELVAVTGRAKRILPLPDVENVFGISGLHEAWIVSADSGVSPYRVVATHLGDNVPTGAEIDVPVTLEGFFFKRQGYSAHSGLVVTPLILAGEIAWLSEREITAESAGDFTTVLALVFAVIIGVVGLALWRFRKSDLSFRRRHARVLRPTDVAADEFEGIETVDLHDELDRLAAHEDAPQDAEAKDQGPG